MKLVEGCRDDVAVELHNRKSYLLTFLKGSKRDKQKLKEDQPQLYGHFQNVWKSFSFCLATRMTASTLCPGKRKKIFFGLMVDLHCHLYLYQYLIPIIVGVEFVPHVQSIATVTMSDTQMM